MLPMRARCVVPRAALRGRGAGEEGHCGTLARFRPSRMLAHEIEIDSNERAASQMDYIANVPRPSA
jgi:hypothetical protein